MRIGGLIVAAMVTCAAAGRADNPLHFREYNQSVVMRFADEAAAAKANLAAKGLPAAYKLAFSARWDDSALGHLKTHDLMVKHKLKGTFFLNNVGHLKRHPDYLTRLLSGGCSIGLHTVTHPHLPTLNSYAHFREYMENRIVLETAAKTPVNSQVLPFCGWWAPVPIVPRSIGAALMAVGVIASPDVMYPARESEMGYPARSLALSRVLTPGDRVPDLTKLEKQLANHLNNAKALAIQPSLSMSMHSWHTPEGLVQLDKAFARVAANPDWWYCSQNEYGAYRYEALNTRISKKRNGATVDFTVSRVQPFELGARLSLWFQVTGAKPLSVSLGSMHGDSLELPHDAERTLPDVYDRAGEGGQSNGIPIAALTLTHPSPTEWSAVFNNRGKQAITDLAFSFRFPSAWENPVIRKDAGTLASGENLTVTASQPARKPALYYRYGDPYYAVQCDFVADGKRYRLYADLAEKSPETPPLTANEAAAVFDCPENPDLARLSQPETDPLALGLAPAAFKRLANTGAGVVYPKQAWDKTAGKTAYLAVIDFKAKTPGPINLKTTAWDARRKSEIWLNGGKLAGSRNGVDLTLDSGVNRIVIKAPRNKYHALMLNGEQEACVEFIK
jgi:peptidoglycan/xylan/chitin deacetylase (PgdA/CDA1 family)